MSAAAPPTFEGDFTFASELPFALSGGGSLQPVTLRYAHYGAISPQRDNVILVCHALSGSARVAEWWPEMIGPGQPLDTSRFCILGINVLGSCYGSTGPTSINPRTGKPYGGDFPLVGVNDMVRAQTRLLDHLGVQQVYAVVGGSIGGLQALSWAVHFPERVPRCVVIGAAPLGAMGLALSHLQRQAIMNDPAWKGGHYDSAQPPATGLALARALAMVTYKSAGLFQERYGRRPNRGTEKPHEHLLDRFDVGGYLDYQGKIFVDRFDANSYLAVSKAMDTFELGRTPDEERAVLRHIRARMLLVGIVSDWLFPPEDIRQLAEVMRSVGVEAQYVELDSTHGHDGFLADSAQLAPLIAAALCEPVLA